MFDCIWLNFEIGAKRFSWFFYWIQKMQKCANLVDLVKSFQSLSMSLFLNFFSNEIAIHTSIYYLLAKIGF